MSQRVSRQAISTHIGRVIFGQQATAKLIAHKLGSLPTGTFDAAMKRRGLGSVPLSKVVNVLSGKDKLGMAEGALKRMVEALQEVGVAKHGSTAHHLVAVAVQEVQKGHGRGSLDPHARQPFLGVTEPEPIQSTTSLESATGVLGRQRGGATSAMQQANYQTNQGASSALEAFKSHADTKLSSKDDGSIRSLRQSMQSALGLLVKKLPPRP